MGGFLLNGCGVADSVSKLRLLKTEHCSTCGKACDFYLAKIKLKIHIAFIPTISLNTKYGIVCAKCKTGNYITEEQMRELTNADEESKVLLFDAIMHPENNDNVQAAECPQTPKTPQKNTSGESSSIEIDFKANDATICKHCGQKLTGGESFCGYCGMDLKAPQECSTSVEPETEKGERLAQNEALKFCSQCGKSVSTQVFFCSQCGAPLTPSAVLEAKKASVDIKKEINMQSTQETVSVTPAKELDCVNAAAGKWECPLCMTRNDNSMKHCQLCGHAR